MSYSSHLSMPSVDDNTLLSVWEYSPMFEHISFADDPNTAPIPREPGIVAAQSDALSSTFLPGAFTRGIDWNLPAVHTDAIGIPSSSSHSFTFSPDDWSDLGTQFIPNEPTLQHAFLPWSTHPGPQGHQPAGSIYPLGGHSSVANVPVPQAEGDLLQTDYSSRLSRDPPPVDGFMNIRTQIAPANRQLVDVGTQTGEPPKVKMNKRRKISSSEKVHDLHFIKLFQPCSPFSGFCI